MRIGCRVREGHRFGKNSGIYSSAIRGCHEDASSAGTTCRDLLKLPGRTKLMSWQETCLSCLAALNCFHGQRLAQVAWPHLTDITARDLSSSGNTCPGQAGLVDGYEQPCSL
eukprot:365881-Chlamydomonas_euryale.AAC.3